MKLNSNSILRPVSSIIIALFFMAGLNNLAIADNAAALKDAIKTDTKVAEVKTTDMKGIDSLAKAPADDDFKKLDANKDGKISLKEAVKDKALASSFDAIDANHDGMVSADEYASYKAALAVKSTEAVPATN
jgi:uncharacterized lipoprotein YajG